MTPADIIAWALAIAIAWIVIALCIPIERWVSDYFATRLARLKSLEARMHALEQRSEPACIGTVETRGIAFPAE